MEVLVINPPYEKKVIREGRCEQSADSYQYLMVSISLPYVAAILREKHKVKIIDCIADDISYEKLKWILEKQKPGLVIVNIATFSFESDIKAATLCKELKIPCAAIGVHVTTTPDSTLKNSDFQFLIKGEPEITSLELVNALEKKKSLKKVDGISYREKGKIIHNKLRKPLENLDRLPFPARDLLDNEKYIMPMTHKPYTLLVPSRGCPHSCVFCTAHHYYGKKQRHRSVENIIQEVKEILFKHNLQDIGMWSDTFTLNKKLVMEFCKAVKKENLKFRWYCNSRVDCLDDELVREMASAGCKVMTFGVESLNKEVLEKIKKRITPEQVQRAIKLCKKYKIQSQVHIIFGLPGETKETIRETIHGVLKLKPDYAQFYCAVPFPGTEFYEYASKNSFINTKEWEKYEINKAIVSYPHLSDKEIQEGMKEAYKKFYFRPVYVFRTFKDFPLKKWPSLIKQSLSFMRGWAFSSE